MSLFHFCITLYVTYMLLAASVEVFFRQLFWYPHFIHLLVSHVVMDNQVS